MKKLFHSLFVVLLALCMLFAMAACDNGSKGETPGGDDTTQGGSGTPGGDDTTGGNGGDSPAAKLDRAYWMMLQQEHITIDADIKGVGTDDTGLHTADIRYQLAKNELYGYDMFLSLMTDGKLEQRNLVVDGIAYDAAKVDGDLLYYPHRLTESDTAQMKLLSMWYSYGESNTYQIYEALASLIGLDDLEGIDFTASQDGIALTVRLEEVRQSFLAWLESFKSQPVDPIADLVEKLFDENITVADFLDTIDGVLAPHGLPLEDILTDEYLLTALIVGFSNGFPPADVTEEMFSAPAQFIYEFLSENAGAQVGNILSEPKEGETIYTYLRRVFGQFKITGIIDMFTGETDSGAQGFADLKAQFSAWTEQSDDLYDLIDFILYNSERTHLDEIVYGLSQVEFGDSYAELTIGVDESGKIVRASFALDYEQRNADPSDHYVDEMRIQIEGTLNVSYDAFTLNPPSEDQLLPYFGTLQIDEDAGSIFIPVEWNCTEPGEAYADVDLSFEAWSEEGYYLGSDSLDARNLSIEQTQEGIFLDLTGSWEGLRQAIDQLLTGGYGDIPFRYEIRMWITVTLHHEYLNFEGLYSAEGDEIIHAHITFEGPWIIW